MLSNTALEKLTIKKGKRHPDERGLYLFITGAGAKSFRFDYRWPRTAKGRRQTLTYGTFPAVSLAQAREKHAEARKLLAAGVNPAEHRRQQKHRATTAAENTFRAIAEKWYAVKSPSKSNTWRANARRWLEISYPTIGGKPIEEVTPADVLSIIRRVEDEGKAVSADRIRKMIGMIFDYAAINLLTDSGLNPARSLRGAITIPAAKSHPHLKTREIPEFYSALARDSAEELTKCGARLLFLTFTRIRELLGAEWTEVDLERASWEVPTSRMKTRNLAHVVPLSDQAVVEFKRLKELTGSGKYVFPNRTRADRHASPATYNAMFNRMGFRNRLSPHGIRSTASTALNEIGFRGDVIERQLAHVDPNKVRGVYNRADYLAERGNMMQAWATLLDDLIAGRTTSGENVIQLQRAAVAA
jgi:integrase